MWLAGICMDTRGSFSFATCSLSPGASGAVQCHVFLHFSLFSPCLFPSLSCTRNGPQNVSESARGRTAPLRSKLRNGSSWTGVPGGRERCRSSTAREAAIGARTRRRHSGKLNGATLGVGLTLGLVRSLPAC